MIPALFAAACLGVALALATWASSAGADGGGGIRLSRPVMITLLAALTIAPVAVALLWSMGLRYESLAVRLVIFVPLGLSVLLTVALMLDTHFRAPGLAGPAGPGLG